MEVKYQYALSNSGALIPIFTLSPETRRDGSPFRCPGCDSELLPALGKRNRPHFRHKTERPCAPESYLHHLAKHAFAQSYLNAVTARLPFELVLPRVGTCTAYRETLSFECLHPTTRAIDLTRYFPHADVEREWGGFRADVLLSTANRDEVTFVEFVVTNIPSEEKRESGHRIIEIRVEGEESIEALRQPSLDPQRLPIKFHNFKMSDLSGNLCTGDCIHSRQVYVFTVYQSGKSILREVPPREAVQIRAGNGNNRSAVYEELYGIKNAQEPFFIFRDAVRVAYFKGVTLKNCYLCKYHGIGNGDSAIFCKLKKVDVGSNDAVTCDAYRTVPTLEAYQKIDAANEEYQKKRGFGWQLLRGSY